MWLLFCYFYSGHSCSGDMNAANHTPVGGINLVHT
jgi:hypothetical protein